MPVSHRRIDHLVIAVRDLDAAAGFCERLGFQVGQRNRHPWGTENRLVQFRSSFLELITVGDDPAAIPPHGPGRFSFGAFVRDYLERREGGAMFVLDSSDAEADAAEFARLGIGRFEPFFFERKGRRPDGSETRVAFTLAFTMDPALPDTSFFVCHQHCPENFWNPEFQVHPNGAANIQDVTLDVAEPSRHAQFLSGYVGVAGEGDDRGGLVFPLREGGRLLVERRATGTGISGFTVAVPDLVGTATRLESNGVPFRRAGDCIAVDAFGLTIGFAGHGA
ncbi:MAG TPA: VOC family protein [Aquamicrobium sp.]|nr:VOC family protein [Aquamicrobium sp.]